MIDKFIDWARGLGKKKYIRARTPGYPATIQYGEVMRTYQRRGVSKYTVKFKDVSVEMFAVNCEEVSEEEYLTNLVINS